MTVMPRTVVIPTEVADWPEAQLKPILAHEFAHARRFDAVTMFASGLVCAIAWPIPFVWLLRRELVRAIEDAADDHVLTQNIDPFTYAETLHRACQALRVAPASVPTFARKPMISARIERTLRSAVDRRRISPFYVVALVAVAAAAAAASAQGLLVQEPPAQNLPHIELKNAGKADVELVQLQTMDRSPIYWKPDGTRISVKDAITDNTAIPPKPGDIVVWLRVKTDRPDAMLWAPSLTIHGYTLPTNSGPSYRREGWLYSASRIATNGRKLPDYGDLNTSAYISDWTDLPPFLTADMIAKSQGKDKRFPLEGFYHSVKWEIRDHVWQHNKPGTRQVESEPPKQSILLDLGMKHGLDPIFDNFSTQFKFKDESKKGRVIYAASEKEEYDEAMTHQKYWLETDVSNIEKMWMQVRCGDHSVIKDVALRPKS
jgi:hypothetical protein